MVLKVFYSFITNVGHKKALQIRDVTHPWLHSITSTPFLVLIIFKSFHWHNISVIFYYIIAKTWFNLSSYNVNEWLTWFTASLNTWKIVRYTYIILTFDLLWALTRHVEILTHPYSSTQFVIMELSGLMHRAKL